MDEQSMRSLSYLYDDLDYGFNKTRRADPQIVNGLANFISINSDRNYLDIACGTGTYTHALNSMGGNWYGVDISRSMLGSAKATTKGLDLTLADAESLPFESGKFDSAVCVNAVHFMNVARMAKEARRVIDGGALVIFTALAEQVHHYWLREYFPVMIERSCSNMLSYETLYEHLISAGFDRVARFDYCVDADCSDYFLYAGKQRPYIYLDASVRRNMSQFDRWSDADELKVGLERLKSDLEFGRFDHVSSRYVRSDVGDCAFIVAYS